MPSRRAQFEKLFPGDPTFRWKQIETGLFSSAQSWDKLTTLTKSMRDRLSSIPWMTVVLEHIQVSGNGDTHKALLKVDGDKLRRPVELGSEPRLPTSGQIETVLMKNPRGAWTICVSSQVGCAMRCGFCATGKMGLTRNLTADEIVDQYRFWKSYLIQTEPRLKPGATDRISNVVFMGMGEPLANYEEVKSSLNTLLTHTDLGKTRITVSTVGVLPRLEQILTDKDWPHVRLAVSLHSAIASTRKQIVPTSYDDFLPKLEDWAKRYLEIFGNRRHHLTFEYVMLKGVNDTPAHAKALANFVNRIGHVRVNLIPYNLTGVEFECSEDSTIKQFLAALNDRGVVATQRRTMGSDIAAACGQLIVLTSSEPS